MSKKNKEPENLLEDALDIFESVSLLVEVQGEAFKISNFKFLEGLKVIKILKDHPNAIPFDLFDMDKEKETDNMLKIIMEAIVESGDVVTEILQLHLKKDDEWMEQLEFDNVVDLTLAIVKANKDFFTQTLLPKIPTSIKESF